MTIQWLGHACFAIRHKGYTIIIDPYNSDYTAGYPKAASAGGYGAGEP